MTVDLIVAVPAHNEQDAITKCLDAVQRAVGVAVQAGHVGATVIAVAAHRCQDATVLLARAALSAPTLPAGQVDTLIRIDNRSDTVGQVRSRLIIAAAHQIRDPRSTWVFNTDADSVVPSDWITATLDQARTRSAAAVAGMVALADWHSSPRARHRYRQIIDAGITADGHEHVYGANLAVRWDAYCDVDGFTSVPHGEDTRLVSDLRSAGHRVAATFSPLVMTSGRMPGRAEHGLGSLLDRLVRNPAGDAMPETHGHLYDNGRPQPASEGQSSQGGVSPIFR
jgi:hypothetical protein